MWAAGPGGWPLPVLTELPFAVLFAAGLAWCWGHPKGWTNNVGCAAAFVLLAVYLAINAAQYRTLAGLYLAGIETEYPSWGKALVAIKLILACMGVVAGVPAAAAPTGREYADKLRQAVYRQEAEWAKGSARGAKKDLDATMHKLKESLSPQEYAELLARMKQDADAQ